MVELPGRIDLILSMVRALLGHITPQVRAVSAELDAARMVVRVRFVLDRDPDEDTLDAASCAATEVIAEFPSEWQLDEQHPIVPSPQPMEHLRELVYFRWERDESADLSGL